MIVEYCGFSYYADGRGYYNIGPPFTSTLPSNFYKYYALTEHSVDALTNSYVYASHPNQFNDPFDCFEGIIEFSTWDDVNRLWCQLFKQIKDTFSNNLIEICNYSSKAFRTLLYRKLGIVSLSPDPNSSIMWAQYGSNNGFCLEYDIHKFPFAHFGPFPINYVEELPKSIKIGEVGGHLAMLIQSNIKNKCWKYENEYRLLIPNPPFVDMLSFGNEAEKFNMSDEHDRKFKYPINALRSIRLGTKFFKIDLINTISVNEIDVCFPDEHQLEARLLDFIGSLQQQSDLKVYYQNIAGFSDYSYTPINVIRLSKIRFKIQELPK